MSITDKISTFLRSPKGRQLVDRGRRELSKPENQAKIRKLMDKNRKR